MARYIDADKIDFSPLKDGFDRARAVTIIKFAPTTDVVEVVRCKDCRYFTKGTLWEICKVYSTNQVERIVQKDHFCSYGKRRDT